MKETTFSLEYYHSGMGKWCIWGSYDNKDDAWAYYNHCRASKKRLILIQTQREIIYSN